VGARFLRALAPVLGIIEAAVGHDTPYAGVGFALVRSRSSMERCHLPRRGWPATIAAKSKRELV
jgi:hypothetical protein